MRTKRCLIAAAIVVALGAGAPSVANAKRFHGYVAGVGSGRGHHNFIIGNGLDLVFRDTRRAHTRYRVCWVRTDGRYHRCWHPRRTGRRGKRSKIFTAAPHHVGTFRVRWRVHGHVVARWRFYNGQGD
jgi:hypothetical protein